MGFSRIVRTAVLPVAAAVALTVSAAYADPAPADVDRQLQSAWQQLEGVIERYDTVREEMRATTAQLATVAAQLGPLRAAADAAQARVGELAAGMYRTGGIQRLGPLLTAGSPGQLLDQLALLEHLSRDRQREFSQLEQAHLAYRQQLTSLTELSARQRAQQAELAARKTAIEAEIQRLEVLRGRAGRGGAGLRTPRDALRDGYVPAVGNDAAGAAVRFAYSQLGKVYRYAAEGPDAYDCSGLTMAAWKAGGVSLPHSAARQFRTVRRIDRSQLKPGDLVFYYRDVHHVAMYVGDGRVIEAPQAGQRVSIRPMDYAPIAGYGRVA